MKPFWITSMGRTGTKWLAVQLRVQHEPKIPTVPFRAVSPKHLWMWFVQGWRPPGEVELAVIVRTARDQLLSVVNRSHSFHKDPAGRIRQFQKHAPHYLEILGRFVDEGAMVISYERMTSDRRYLQTIANTFDCTVSPLRFGERINAFKTRDHSLTPPQEKLAATMQQHYDRWLSVHDTRSSTAGGSSGTTTSSEQRSQPCEPTEPDSSKRP